MPAMGFEAWTIIFTSDLFSGGLLRRLDHDLRLQPSGLTAATPVEVTSPASNLLFVCAMLSLKVARASDLTSGVTVMTWLHQRALRKRRHRSDEVWG
jgi:hypothetical protein